MKLFRTAFPTSKIKGCQFHFGQNIWKQTKKKGLVCYSHDDDDDDDCQQIANILMLPLSLPQEIITAFSEYY